LDNSLALLAYGGFPNDLQLSGGTLRDFGAMGKNVYNNHKVL
jgi:hypothetical protein